MDIGSMDFFERVLYFIQNYGSSFLEGAEIAAFLAVAGTALGCLIGFLAGAVSALEIEPDDSTLRKAVLRVARAVIAFYVWLFRGTPMMVQAMVIFYGSAYFGADMDPVTCGLFIVSINTGAYMAETVRGGILSIDPGQTEGAKAIGMTHVQTMLYVILPQALRNIMPQIGNNLIINIKDSCVLSVIGVTELLYKTKAAAGALYMNFEAYTITMIVYFIMTFTCSRILRWWENRMDGADNYDLATTDTLAHTSGMYRFPDEKDKKKEDAR